VSTLETLINGRTRAIVMVTNAGTACDMETEMYLTQKYGLYVVEDSAHSIDSWYQERYLGGIRHLDTFSFHETENINSGEGYRFKFRQSDICFINNVVWPSFAFYEKFTKILT
jgi:dTDP-4-amino-4,6-dideoxygalactose transaminase